MKIIVIGAGVLGSLYAAKLQESGHSVTIMARGKRLDQIKKQGILLENQHQQVTCTQVEVVEALNSTDSYDLAIILVRKNQLESVLPMLANNQKIPGYLFMVNSCSGPQTLVDALGYERVILGFPGAGGERREDGTVCYRIVNPLIQPTTIGELNGTHSERIKTIAEIFKKAGFPTEVSPNMDAWLKTHVAVVSPVANAIYLAGGDNYRLANTRDGLVLMVRAIREGLTALQSLNIPITPFKYRFVQWIPEVLLVAVLGLFFNTKQAELVLARHANSARDEMLTLANELKDLTGQAQTPTTALDFLYSFVNPEQEPVPFGSCKISLNWQEIRPFLIGGAALVGFIAWAFHHKNKK